jgi:hypothetical protein
MREVHFEIDVIPDGYVGGECAAALRCHRGGVARKKVLGPDGKVLMYMDVMMKSITPRTFEILAAALVKK